MKIRLLHTADLHLDSPLLYLGQHRKFRRRELLGTVTSLVDLALTSAVDAVLICGDLFDSVRADSAPWVKVELERLAEAGIFVLMVPGNHDQVPACSAYAGGWPANVHVFRSEGWTVFDRLPGVNFYGLAYQAGAQEERVLRGLVREKRSGWQVGLLHGQVRLTGIQADNYQPIAPEDIAASGLDYLALGHYHRLMDCSLGQTRAFYPGAPHRLDFSQVEQPQALIVTLDSEAGVQVEPVALPDRPFQLWEGDAAEPDGIYRQLRLGQDSRACVRLKLVGPTQDGAAALIADLYDKFAQEYFSLVIEDQTIITTADDAPASTVQGVFKRRMNELLAQCAGEEERRLTELAYGYGLAALRGNKLP